MILTGEHEALCRYWRAHRGPGRCISGDLALPRKGMEETVRRVLSAIGMFQQPRTENGSDGRQRNRILRGERAMVPRVLSGIGEPDEPHSELSIHIVVPEEFAGMSMAELNSRRGAITEWMSRPGAY